MCVCVCVCVCVWSITLQNPIQPDGLYDLDLRVPEDRSVASMLVVLAAEPGENWLDETYNGTACFVAAEAPLESLASGFVFSVCRENLRC